jgi:Protein of unknown function (DUF2971)
VPLNKKFRQLWIDAGYDSNMGSAEVVPPPSGHRRRVYYMTSAEFGISNIGLGRIKVARIADLNDPFEFMAVNFREREKRVLISDFKDRQDSVFGLLCFSGNWIDPVLWSHYGDKHRGICLGFDVATTLVKAVDYAPDRRLQKFDLPEGELDNNLQSKLRFTKSEHWSYEKEWRVFVRLENMLCEKRVYFYPFDHYLTLTEVILGIECSLSLHAVRQLTASRYPRPVTFKARRSVKGFAVVPDDDTVP